LLGALLLQTPSTELVLININAIRLNKYWMQKAEEGQSLSNA
jgi:hypothetical protein